MKQITFNVPSQNDNTSNAYSCVTFEELKEEMIKFNQENAITTKGVGPVLKAVIVFTEDTFSKPYSLEERSYKITNHNKAFIPRCFSDSIFGDSLDGSDRNVRLHNLIGDWKIDYCYIQEN